MKRRWQIVAAGLAATVVSASVAVAASSPTVVTGAKSAVTQTSAVLHGTVNPNGASTTYLFQWGLTSAYGVNGTTVSAGAGTRSVSVRQTAGSLIPGTTYHYRLVATNGYGTTVGADRTFTTTGHPPPGVTTGPASALNATGATLTGEINPDGLATTWWMQWGTTTSYSNQTTAQTVPAGTAPTSVAASLQGQLAPGTIFHYRLVATHGSAATYSYGADASFMTYPSRRPVASLRATLKPLIARRRPYVLTTTGSVAGPSSIPPAYGCSGNVRLRFFKGRTRVATTFAGVQSNCTFGALTVFKRLPRHPKGQRTVALKEVITFIGNSYLAPAQGHAKHVVLG